MDKYMMKFLWLKEYCRDYFDKYVQLYGRDMLIIPTPIGIKNQSKLVRYMENERQVKLFQITFGYLYFKMK